MNSVNGQFMAAELWQVSVWIEKHYELIFCVIWMKL